MKTPRIESSLRPPWRCSFVLIPLALSFLGLPPEARAVCQQGCDQLDNTFFGEDALINNSGDGNTALGAFALHMNTTGSLNTAIGAIALSSNTEGETNTATGTGALSNNTTGDDNTANGGYALYSNTTGSDNTATGRNALQSNTTGSQNTANGTNALINNTTGGKNTAIGNFALDHNTIASSNTAIGYFALPFNNTGYRNTAIGANALNSNSVGHGNTAIGFQALYNNNGSNNVGLGFNAGINLITGTGNVCIGYNVPGVAGENSTTRISNIYSSLASGRAVYVNADNKIGTIVSSRRFKEDIKPMDTASEAILALKPVTFHYKKEIEPNGSIMFGLIAEEVEQVDPDLVTRNKKGEAEAVRYEAVNAMLLNEFLKEHRQVQEQQKQIEKLTVQLKEQAEQIRNVNDKLEMNGPAPQMAVNDP